MKKKKLDLQQIMIDILYKFCEEEKLDYDSVCESMMSSIATFYDYDSEEEEITYTDKQENFIERYMNIDDRMNDHIYFNDQYRVLNKEDRIEKIRD